MSLAGPNLEARARQARYAFLKEAALDLGCEAVATGHTIDDQAETVLLRLLRGTGVRGLRGILPARADGIVRPLLESSRQDVLDFLRRRRLTWREDSSNRSADFLRNRVRHEALPPLLALAPRLPVHLAHLAEIARDEARALEACAGELVDRTGLPPSLLPVSLLAQLPGGAAAPIVRAWLERRGDSAPAVGRSHLAAVVALARTNGGTGWVDLPGGGRIRRDGPLLCLERGPREREEGTTPARITPGELKLPVPGEVAWGNGHFRSLVLTSPPAIPREGEPRWLADLACLPGPCLLRPVRPGDRIRPFGMQGSRKLQDVFVDRRVPPSRRWNGPVIEAAGEILWVPGVVRSHHAPLRPETREVLCVEFLPGEAALPSSGKKAVRRRSGEAMAPP